MCQRIRSSIACLPSRFTGTALLFSLPLTTDFLKSRSPTGFLFWYTSPTRRLSSSLIRPPVLTPSMNKPRLRTSYVPVKHPDTRSFGECLLSAFVFFLNAPPHDSCHRVLSNLTIARCRSACMSRDVLLLRVCHTDGIGKQLILNLRCLSFLTCPT